MEHLEPGGSRRSSSSRGQVLGGLLISIACGLVYPVVGPGRTFWIALGMVLLAAAVVALVRYLGNNGRSASTR